MWYRKSPDSTNSISTKPGLVRIENRTIFAKFPDLVRFGIPGNASTMTQNDNQSFFHEK